jgi:hypothetical protein
MCVCVMYVCQQGHRVLGRGRATGLSPSHTGLLPSRTGSRCLTALSHRLTLLCRPAGGRAGTIAKDLALRGMLEALLADLGRVVFLPEWPGAEALLCAACERLDWMLAGKQTDKGAVAAQVPKP